jgi:hypothetical protein
MALTFPSSPTNGQTYIDDNNVTWEYNSTKTVWNKLSSSALKQFSGVKLEFTTAVSLTTTSTAISFDSTKFDTDGYFNISSPTKITIPKPGYYRINVLLSTGAQGTTGASHDLTIKKNGTSNLTTDMVGANQSVVFDEIEYLISGDYIEIYGSESGAVGTLTTNTYFEIDKVGNALGSSYPISYNFSGVKLGLSVAENTTSTPTGITWDSAEFNINADSSGNVYWTISDSTKVSIYTTGYYRLKTLIETGTAGGTDSYTIDVRLDNSNLVSSSLSANEKLILDELYNFNSGSYLQVYVDNSGSVGTITTNSNFELIRMGV